MNITNLSDFYSWLNFVLHWIVFILFAGWFSYVFVRWISFRIWPVKYVMVNYYHDGVLTKQTKIDLSSDVPIVRQLMQPCDANASIDSETPKGG